MPNLTPQLGDEDQQLNPGDRHAEALNDLQRREKSAVDDDFGNIVKNEYGDDNDPGATRYNEPSKGELKSREENPDTGFTYRNDDKPKAKGSLSDKLKSRNGILAIGGGVTLIGGIVALVFGMIASFLMHIGANFSEWSTKRGYSITNSRMNKVAQKRYFSEPDANCSGIRCRLSGGISDKEIAQLERAGLITNDESHVGDNGGKKYIKQFTLSDGTVVRGSDFRQALKDKPELRLKMATVSQAKARFYRTTFSIKKLFTLGVNRTNPLKNATKDEDMRKEGRKRVAGVDSDASRRLAVSGENEDDKGTRTSNENFDEAASQIQNEANSQREDYLNNPDSDTIVPDLDEAERIATVGAGALKGAVRGVRVTGALDTICSGYSLFKAADFGAKYYRMLGLVRYAGIFMTFQDAMKAGDVKPEQVAFLAGLLMAPDSQGRSFSDSPGAQYVFYGQTPGRNNLNTKYATGTKLSGILSSVRNEINKLTGGKADSTCKTTRTVGYQIGSTVVSVGLAIVTLGGSVAASVATGASAGLILGVVEAYALPALIQYAAGTTMTFKESGYEAGTALASGMGAMGANMARSQGMRPLQRSEMAKNDAQTARLLADYGLGDKPSPAEVLTSNLAMFSMSTFSSMQSLSLTPQRMLTLATNPVSTSAFASEPAAASDQCDDEDYAALGIATDAYCNPLFGDDMGTVDSDAYDPAAVQDYMIGNGHVDEQSGEPKSDAYKEYASVCLDGIGPLINSDDGESDVNSGELCSRKDEETNMFRYYRMDLSGSEDEKAATDLVANGIQGAAAPAAGGGAAGSLPSGDVRELARQVANNPNVVLVNPRTKQGLLQLADTGTVAAQCGGQGSVSPQLLGGIQALSSKYKVMINNIGINGDRSVPSDCRGATYQHPKGNAADYNGIEIIGGEKTAWGSIRFTQQDQRVIQAYVADFLALMPPTVGGVGQKGCNGFTVNAPPGAQMVNGSFFFPDACTHLHLDTRDRANLSG